MGFKEMNNPTIIALTDYTTTGGKPSATVKRLVEICGKRNITFWPIQVDHAYVIDSDIKGKDITIHNFDGEETKVNVPKKDTVVIVRSGAMKGIARQGLVKSLQEAGLFMVNSLETIIDTSNKFTTAIKLKRAGIDAPLTALVTNEQSIPIAMQEIGGKFPVVAKTIEGSQGIGVMIIESQESLISVLQGLWKHDAEIILQEFMKIEYDVRTLVLNNKIIASVKRIASNEGDFRTNKSLGNKTEPYKLSEEEKKVVLKTSKVADTYFSGVDHCIVDGKIKVLEINSSPGTISESYYNYDTGKPFTGDGLVEKIVDILQERKNWNRIKKTIGVIEWVKIDGMKLKAKFDTGNWAGGTAIHAEKIKKIGKKVSFVFNGRKFVKPILFTKDVKDGGFGSAVEIENRYYIEMNMSIGNSIAKSTICCLDDRSSKTYKVLVNKEWMEDNDILIDSGRKFILGEQIKRVSTFREMYI
jgi:ribosomal protein S6--L-glutamate ligase